MNILLLGSGGREHTLAWKLAQSPLAEKIFVIPGNPGIAAVQKCECVKTVSMEDNQALLQFAQEQKIELVVVGPEVPLMNGVVDTFEKAGIKAFGPSKEAAQLEGSKVFAKTIMKKYGIPTASYEVFHDLEEAKIYVEKMKQPFAIKADGLAAGKGVILTQTADEAVDALDTIMGEKKFGAAGSQVVIEEFMQGEEASILAFTDGKTIFPMKSSQDHKRIFDGDKGENTGGMGTYAPAPVVTPEILKEVQEKILEPIIAAMNQEGKPYKGCVYAGLMITQNGPKVVEFNARFGDPETQVVLPLLKSDLVEIMLACCEGKLAEKKIEWDDENASACVIMSSKGYPNAYEKNKVITGIEDAEKLGALVFHAGTKMSDGNLVTSGGRVLGVVGCAPSLRQAVNKAYEGVAKIHFDGAFYRHDIAHRAFEKE